MAMKQIGKQTFWHVDCVLTGKRYTIAPISITIKKTWNGQEHKNALLLKNHGSNEWNVNTQLLLHEHQHFQFGTLHENKTMTWAQLTFGNRTNDFDSQISLRPFLDSWTLSNELGHAIADGVGKSLNLPCEDWRNVMNTDLTWRFARNIHANFKHWTTSIRRNTHFETHIRSDKKKWTT